MFVCSAYFNMPESRDVLLRHDHVMFLQGGTVETPGPYVPKRVFPPTSIDSTLSPLKLNFRKYPAIHTNYITSQSTTL